MLPISSKDLELQPRGLRLTGHGPLKISIAGAGGFQIFLWGDLQQMASRGNFCVASLPLPIPVTAQSANGSGGISHSLRICSTLQWQNPTQPQRHAHRSVIILQSLPNSLEKSKCTISGVANQRGAAWGHDDPLEDHRCLHSGSRGTTLQMWNLQTTQHPKTGSPPQVKGWMCFRACRVLVTSYSCMNRGVDCSYCELSFDPKSTPELRKAHFFLILTSPVQ